MATPDTIAITIFFVASATSDKFLPSTLLNVCNPLPIAAIPKPAPAPPSPNNAPRPNPANSPPFATAGPALPNADEATTAFVAPPPPSVGINLLMIPPMPENANLNAPAATFKAPSARTAAPKLPMKLTTAFSLLINEEVNPETIFAIPPNTKPSTFNAGINAVIIKF